MPIKINLLAEEQANEELRRKDPVKRAALAAGAVVLLVVVWGLFNWMQLSKLGTNLAGLDEQLKGLEKTAKEAEANLKKIKDNDYRLEMLKKMSSLRPLWAPVLDAIQRVPNDDIQLLRVKIDQAYQVTPAFYPPRGSGPDVKFKPATTKQIIGMTIEAQDNSNDLQAYTRYRGQLESALREFIGANGSVSLKVLNQQREDGDGKKYQTFTLECIFTEVTR
jgi:cell division protein FtsB